MARNTGFGMMAAILVAGGGLIACTSQQANTTGTGGSGAGPGGSTGSGGGAGGGAAISEGTTCPPPAATGLITDFTYVPGDAANSTTQVQFGDSTTTLSGGEFIYPDPTTTSAYPLTSTVTGNNWHITGKVGDYSGLGFFFNNCNRINAMGFTGLSFTVSGTVQGDAVTLEVDTLSDAISPAWLNAHGGSAKDTDAGACTPPATAALNQYSQTTCTEPTKLVPVTTTPTTVTVHWSDFTTGKPDAAPKPTDIVGIRWVLPTPTGVGSSTVATYQVDLTIDNVAFVK